MLFRSDMVCCHFGYMYVTNCAGQGPTSHRPFVPPRELLPRLCPPPPPPLRWQKVVVLRYCIKYYYRLCRKVAIPGPLASGVSSSTMNLGP